MSKPLRYLALLLLLSLSAFCGFAGAAYGQGAKTPAGEEFFIVASIDQPKSQILLKRPTEVTMLAKITPSTHILDENGKPLHLSGLRAGDTVWVVASNDKKDKGEDDAIRVRKGSMTVEELHKSYLDYPEIK